MTTEPRININDVVSVRDLPAKPAGVADWLIGVPSNQGGPPFRAPFEQLPVQPAVQQQIDALAAGQAAGQKVYRTWSELSATTGSAGVGAQVIDDTGTHTDPVVGGTVSNAGQYVWSESPAGWRWVRPDVLPLKADKATVPAIAPIPEDVFVITDAAGNRSWMEAELGTGDPTPRVGAVLRPVLGIEQSIDEATAPLPRVEAIPGDKFQLVDAKGNPSWIEAELGTGRPTAAAASALANVLHYYVGEEQPYVWPDNWLIWVQTDATHNPIQTYIVEG